MPTNLVFRGFMCPVIAQCGRFKKKLNLGEDSAVDFKYDHETPHCDGYVLKGNQAVTT